MEGTFQKVTYLSTRTNASPRVYGYDLGLAPAASQTLLLSGAMEERVVEGEQRGNREQSSGRR